MRNEILFTISKFYLYCLDPFVTWVCLKIPKCVKTSAECRIEYYDQNDKLNNETREINKHLLTVLKNYLISMKKLLPPSLIKCDSDELYLTGFHRMIELFTDYFYLLEYPEFYKDKYTCLEQNTESDDRGNPHWHPNKVNQKERYIKGYLKNHNTGNSLGKNKDFVIKTIGKIGHANIFTDNSDNNILYLMHLSFFWKILEHFVILLLEHSKHHEPKLFQKRRKWISNLIKKIETSYKIEKAHIEKYEQIEQQTK